MNDSPTILSETVEPTSVGRVLAIMVDSATLASETPTQASQPNNVRKCPVLSGPTDTAAQTDLSPDEHKTCDQTPSHPDRTSTGHHPAQPSAFPTESGIMPALAGKPAGPV